MISIRYTQANRSDAEALTQIAHTSKSYWGYPKEWMEMWQSELTITASELDSNYFVKAMSGDDIAGFAGLRPIENDVDTIELLHCWVLADFMSRGIGRGLFDNLVSHVRENSQYKSMRIYSDPHAVKFYQAVGCIEVGQEPTKIEGRTLPIMEFHLR